jgi:hypothetical protein
MVNIMSNLSPEALKKERLMTLFPEKYSGLNNLYEYAKRSGIVELGSSSLSPHLAQSCTEVRTLLLETSFIGQVSGGLNEVWRALGDDSGVLYFGGREIAGHRITVAEHLEYLAVAFSKLSAAAATDVNDIAANFYESRNATPVGSVYCFSKNGTFIIPAEAYKRNMSDEEKEPYRVERDDPRLDRW